MRGTKYILTSILIGLASAASRSYLDHLETARRVTARDKITEDRQQIMDQLTAQTDEMKRRVQAIDEAKAKREKQWARDNMSKLGPSESQMLVVDKYSQVIERESGDDDAYHRRAHAFQALKKWDQAETDYLQALELNPNDTNHTQCLANLYNSRGWDFYKKGKFELAAADYDKAIVLHPKWAAAYNNRAWLRATCPDPLWREGVKAVQDATRACDLTNWKNASFIDTLAAAHAEVGDFARACELEKEAIKLTGKSGRWNRKMLELFQSGNPYRSE